MTYLPSSLYYSEFCTASPTTGAAANADSTPTATANKNGVDDSGFVLTVTNIDTGRYKVSGTVPSGYVKGDVVSVSVSATVGGIVGKSVIDALVVDTKRVGDLVDYAGVTSGERDAIANDLLDLAGAIETGETLRQTIRLLRAVLAGVSTETNGTVVFRRKDGTTTAVTVTHDTTGSRPTSTVGSL